MTAGRLPLIGRNLVRNENASAEFLVVRDQSLQKDVAESKANFSTIVRSKENSRHGSRSSLAGKSVGRSFVHSKRSSIDDMIKRQSISNKSVAGDNNSQSQGSDYKYRSAQILVEEVEGEINSGRR